MSEYRVRAVRWEHGWELHIDDDRVTQSHTLAEAERMVRDYLAADGVPGAADAAVVVVPEVEGFTEEVRAAREATVAAEAAQREAAHRTRRVIYDLKTKRGLTVTDIAKVMGVSKGRISQLMKG